MAADKTDNDQPENDKPENENTSSASDGRTQPEEVETEIVDEESAETGGETYSASETTHDTEDTPADQDKPAKPGGLMSPGLILAGILVLVAAFTLFSYLSRNTDDRDPPVAANDASPVTAALDGPPEMGDPQDVPAEEAPAVPATSREETQVAKVPAEKTGNQSDRMKQAAREEQDAEEAPAQTAQATEEEAQPTAAQLAQQRREAAAERARQRQGREQAQSAEAEATEPVTDEGETPETAMAANDTEADTDTRSDDQAGEQMAQVDDAAEATTEETSTAPAREARAQTATGAVTAEAETDTALQETRAALAEQRQTNARQAREIEALRREIDTALAEQDRRSQQRIAQLETRIEQIQTQDVAAATKQAAIALAVSNLQRQMYSGRPYGDQLAVLERLTGANAPVRKLRENAEDGLPPMSYLQYSFLDAARSALAAARREEATSPLGKFWANFVGLFSVRKVGARSGDSPSAIISRAEASLENGDLEAALRELAALEGEPADAMEPWIEEARARVEADQTLDNLTNNVLSQAG
ncbi:hypothetical protein FF098_009850 [Parvularcula flava]|uniref:Inner membrane protein n=1 Tax=Aquisalinus luteolus TaxID=1566827 RepID=A0A8J3A3X4_9PROT|nr:mitofilin family membrane protein [Aquisalinus luteolus]NHK28206.1 hypothetical protein [Aquisalinus luteolus]GGH97783.1 hypothetical protein GCM10011355_19830 [Aquisalinus luteolus]